MTWRSSIGLMGSGSAWRQVLAVVGLSLVTLIVCWAYAFEPQSPADALDRVTLSMDEGAYGPNLRVGERYFARAARAESVGADSIAESLIWKAAEAFERAAASAAGPRAELAANNRLADVYLDLGVRHLARGRGGRFGIGRETEELRAAENIAACVVGVAPTQRRAAVNAFLVELEEELERAAEGRCPR
jgi:hypothetical protein